MILADVDPASYSVILDATRGQIEFLKWFLIASAPVLAAAFGWLAKQGNDARAQANAATERAILEMKASAEARHVDREKEQELRARMHEENREDMQKLTDAVTELSRQHR